jgi:hypothetical protein
MSNDRPAWVSKLILLILVTQNTEVFKTELLNTLITYSRFVYIQVAFQVSLLFSAARFTRCSFVFTQCTLYSTVKTELGTLYGKVWLTSSEI